MFLNNTLFCFTFVLLSKNKKKYFSLSMSSMSVFNDTNFHNGAYLKDYLLK